LPTPASKKVGGKRQVGREITEMRAPPSRTGGLNRQFKGGWGPVTRMVKLSNCVGTDPETGETPGGDEKIQKSKKLRKRLYTKGKSKGRTHLQKRLVGMANGQK